MNAPLSDPEVRYLEDLLPKVRDVVSRAGDFIREERKGFSQESIETKGHNNDLVSYVDRTVEQRLRDGLQRLTPGCGFLGEEGTDTSSGKDQVWILDPLDGTTNFVFGIPVFSVSVALEIRGIVALGLVLEVNQNELFTAIRGLGARLNGQRIRVASDRLPQDALVATGFPYHDFSRLDSYVRLLAHVMQHTRGVRRLGSAAVDLAYVACGRFDAFFESGLKPWDVAAGGLIVEEAGGRVTTYSDTPDFLYSGSLLASNGEIHAAMLSLLHGN
jgi:myo-inositol-1(or 4)-monophosphatase